MQRNLASSKTADAAPAKARKTSGCSGRACCPQNTDKRVVPLLELSVALRPRIGTIGGLCGLHRMRIRFLLAVRIYTMLRTNSLGIFIGELGYHGGQRTKSSNCGMSCWGNFVVFASHVLTRRFECSLGHLLVGNDNLKYARIELLTKSV